MKPIIGVTTKLKKNEKGEYIRLKYSYIDVIKKAGGIPLVIPNKLTEDDKKKYISIIDGLILTGGEDVSPLLYNENPIKEVAEISNIRDESELMLLDEAYLKKIPILGICRGLQLINVYLKGTLYQDIYIEKENVLGHTSFSTIKKGHHNININKDSFIYDVFKKSKIVVNSYHHQAIKELGLDLKITAKSDDDIIEAIEGVKNKNILGFQFHPEEMVDNDDKFLKLFKKFIKMCEDKNE